MPDLEHYERLLLGKALKLRGVADVRSNFAIRTVKSNGALLAAPLVEARVTTRRTSAARVAGLQ